VAALDAHLVVALPQHQVLLREVDLLLAARALPRHGGVAFGFLRKRTNISSKITKLLRGHVRSSLHKRFQQTLETDTVDRIVLSKLLLMLNTSPRRRHDETFRAFATLVKQLQE